MACCTHTLPDINTSESTHTLPDINTSELELLTSDTSDSEYNLHETLDGFPPLSQKTVSEPCLHTAVTKEHSPLFGKKWPFLLSNPEISKLSPIYTDTWMSQDAGEDPQPFEPAARIDEGPYNNQLDMEAYHWDYYDEPNFGPSESFNSEHDDPMETPSDTSLLQTILDSSSFAHYSRFMENFESPLPPDQILHGQTEGQHNSTNVTSPKRQPRPPTPFFFGYTEAQDQ